MIVRDRMTKEPMCISKDVPITKALDLMEKNNFHRLPVVEGKRMIGLVTEGVIEANSPSKATSLSMFELNYLLSKTQVESIMIREEEVVTISPDALLEEAAVKMRKHDISCLPVIERDEIVGIITQNDIFESFVDMLGYYSDTTRFTIRIDNDKQGVLAELCNVFFSHQKNITHIVVTHRDQDIHIVIRANTEESFSDRLKEAGFEVVSAIKTNQD